MVEDETGFERTFQIDEMVKIHGRGELKEELFSEIGMDIHFGALFFLLNLQMDLLKSILNSSMEKVTNPNMKQILERSGQLILQSFNSPAEILQK